MHLRELLQEIHERSVWQVLAVYIVGAAVGYELIEALVSGLGLPDWFPALAIILFIVGLPIVLATAVIQHGGPQPLSEPADPTLLPGAEPEGVEVGGEPARSGLRRLFTWRNAILGGLAAFSVWGIVATVWLLTSGPEVGGPSVGGPDPGRQMLVVLPFENLGPTEHEYFADGITEEISSRLAAVSGLGVISRTSAMRYKNTDKGLREIGEELGVDYVLEGTILWQQAADGPSEVRVTPQLIRVDDDTHVWADRYDAVLSDIFAVQSGIASQVIDALDVALGEREKETLEARPTENLEAYDLYLRGKDYSARSIQREDLELAIELFERAIELDPEFAAAYASLALAQDLLYWFGDRDRSRAAAVKAAAEKALELDPDLPEAHIALGYYYYHGQLAYERALAQLALARSRRPNDAQLWAGIAYIQRRQGDWEESVRSLDRAIELDPRSSRLMWNQCWTFATMHELARARLYCDRAIRVSPDIPDAYSAKALVNLMAGHLESNVDLLAAATERADRTAYLRNLVSTLPLFALFRAQETHAAALAELELDDFEGDSVSYYLAQTSLFGQRPAPEAERAYFDSARATLERRLSVSDAVPLWTAAWHSLLGYAYAGLDRPTEAVREAERAVELVPVDRAALEGALFLGYLAEVLVLVGDYERAIDQLERVLPIPSYHTAAILKADPLFDPLRDHPRFRALLERHDRN